jgi:hypothetical protein
MAKCTNTKKGHLVGLELDPVAGIPLLVCKSCTRRANAKNNQPKIVGGDEDA